MKYKIISFLIMIGCWTANLKAQSTDLFQVIPFKADPGLTTDDGFMISFQLNSSQPYWGIQFELKLPEGMTLDDTDGAEPFELSTERFPYTKRGSKVTFKHGVAYGKKKDNSGWYIIVISPNDNTSYISAGNGEFLYAYIKTAADMKPGVYPIYIRSSLMVVTTTLYTRPAASTSYCTIGDASLPQTSKVALTDFTGQIPSWVVANLNNELNQNASLREVDLTNADMLDADFEWSNRNTLLYVNANSQYAKALNEREDVANNIVTIDAENATCRSLVLNDNYPFSCTTPFHADKVVLHRQGFSKGWNTLCLPFELTDEQVKSTWGLNAQMQQFATFSDNTIHFEVANAAIAANTPCLLYVDADNSSTDFAFDNVSVCATPQIPSVAHNGLSFTGNYGGRISAQNLYGITSENTLRKGGANAHINGFRAYFDLPLSLQSQPIQVAYEGMLTGIKPPQQSYQPQSIFSIDGRPVNNPMQHGIYIINNQKTIVR